MSLFDNELIQKYFGCKKHWGEIAKEYCQKCVSIRPALVLQAMQEPIKKGEKFLLVDSFGGSYGPKGHGTLRVIEFVSEEDHQEPIHNELLRLPEQFQEPKCECHSWSTECPSCGKIHKFVIEEDNETNRKEVEEEIERLVRTHVGVNWRELRNDLDELVRLAQGKKK